jgi:hypothetical protein
MSLLAIAIVGAVVSLLMMAGGFVWLGVRHELQVTRMDQDEAADLVVRGWWGRPGRTWFRGLASGVSFYAEKPTREIIELLVAGRWSEGLPWAVPALGALPSFFFWTMLVGVLAGLEGPARSAASCLRTLRRASGEGSPARARPATRRTAA